jgi:hypothetical protein
VKVAAAGLSVVASDENPDTSYCIPQSHWPPNRIRGFPGGRLTNFLIKDD